MHNSLHYVSEARAVIFLAIFAGVALSMVEATLGPRIAENVRRQTYDRIPELVPGASSTSTQEISLQPDVGSVNAIYAACDESGTLTGWVLRGQEQGYSGPIVLLVGVDPQASRITGLFVLQQTETPGLGALITRDSFLEQFSGLPANTPIQMMKHATQPGQVQAVSGATISSVAVADAVNRTLSEFRNLLEKPDSRDHMLEQLPSQGKDV